MRKLLVSLAAAGTAFAFATPAAAQWAPRPGYGYNNAAAYEQKLQYVRYKMDKLAQLGRLTGGEARNLEYDIQAAQAMIYRAGRGGIGPWEARQIDQRIDRIRWELNRYSDSDVGYNRYNAYNRYKAYNRYNGYNREKAYSRAKAYSREKAYKQRNRDDRHDRGDRRERGER